MLPGEFSAADVATYLSRVTVNGVNRPALSVDLDGAWRSDLPSQLGRGGSSMQRDGKVEWATERDVLDRPVTAFQDWGVWRPQKGDRIVVYAGDGVTEWRRFTGIIDETTGSVGTGMQSTIVADIDRLAETFQCEALMARQPPREGSTSWRWSGLTTIYHIDAAMRAGGYYLTTPQYSYSELHAPLQGSLLPAVGHNADVILAGSYSLSNEFHNNWPAPWGMSVGNCHVVYEPALKQRASDPVQISVMRDTTHNEIALITARYGVNNHLRLVLNGSGSVSFERRGPGGTANICYMSAAATEGATRFEVVVRNGTATLRHNNGGEVTGSVSGLEDNRMDQVIVTAGPAARIAGVQVSHPVAGQENYYLDYQPTARFHSTPGHNTTWGQVVVAPRYNSQAASTALETLADLSLSAMWIDEHGALNFAPSGGIRTTPSVQTITTADDVLSLAWSDRVLATARRITVAHDHAVLTRSNLRTITVATGSRNTLYRGEVDEQIYQPGSDEEWHGFDGNPLWLPGPAGWGQYNSGIGSMVGVTGYAGDSTDTGGVSPNVEISLYRIGVQQYSLVHDATNLHSQVDSIETSTHPDHPDLWQRNRNNPLPVFRAWARTQWVEQETTRQTNQPGPHLRIKLGRGVTAHTAGNIRDYLHDLIVEQIPTITSMEVTPDPRRQIGDTITLQSENYLGVTIRAKVTGISESITADGYTQSLDLEPTLVTPGALTWEEWETAFPGTLSYDQWMSLRDTTDTYNDFNTDPLKGADAS